MKKFDSVVTFYKANDEAKNLVTGMEDYARQNDMNVVDTVFKDDKAIDKLTYYIEREGIICILVRSIWDISTDRETVKSIMKLASDHNISINEENKGFEPATLVWDGGAGC